MDNHIDNNKFNNAFFIVRIASVPRYLTRLAVGLVLTVFLGGCFTAAATRDFARPGGTTPWWCQGPPDLSEEDCIAFSLQLDVLVIYASDYPTLADFQAAGAVNVTADAPAGTGEAYSLPGADRTSFDALQPQALLYSDNTPDAQLAGVLWIIEGPLPAGFDGARDVWTSTGASRWALPAWIIRGYHNHPDVFASSHPCLAPGVTLNSTGDPCYLASHTTAFEVLVTNSDGVQSQGTDVLVEELHGLNNAVVEVVAPLTNQSGSGDLRSGSAYVVSGSATTTLSGKPATAVLSTDPATTGGSGTPADAVVFALTQQYLSPDVVIAGVNEGQNLSNFARDISGTVGAARIARNRGVPAIASHQGVMAGEATDYPSGAEKTLEVLELWRLGRTSASPRAVLNINTPTCAGGQSPRSTLFTGAKALIETGDVYQLQDCASIEPEGNIDNDLEAFNNGFVGVTDINRTDSLRVTAYNVGLALNFVPFTRERLVANEALIEAYESDVICFQEVWLQESVDAVMDALDGHYPHVYTEPPQQIFSETAACTTEEIADFEDCVRTECPGLTGSDLVACAPAQCGAFLGGLSPTCLDGVISAVGIPDVTVDDVVAAVTQPAGKFAFDGSLGLILASKYELKKREFQDFIDNSSGNRRGALYAEVVLNNRAHVVGCTHPTANLSATLAYPSSGNFGSWEEENEFMQMEMIDYVNTKAGAKPIFFGGDFNCSFANAVNGVDGDFEANCQLWLNDGFSSPAADQLPCTFCQTENLVLLPDGGTGSWLLDHVFVKNLDPPSPIVAERVFDDTVLIEALNPVSELAPEDSPMLTHPSDHFGVQLDVELP